MERPYASRAHWRDDYFGGAAAVPEHYLYAEAERIKSAQTYGRRSALVSLNVEPSLCKLTHFLYRQVLTDANGVIGPDGNPIKVSSL